MTLKIYNSLGREKVVFEPLVPGKVSMYVCGPTVYDNAHLGHGRSAVAFDVIRRYLIYKYGAENVTYATNYTDIDDKMIKRADEEGITVAELAAKVIPEYEADYGALGVMKADIQPKATEYIEAMVEIVQCLDEKGCTYVIEGDGVYFDVTKFEEYGKLSGNTLEALQAGSRVEVKDGKRNPQDFVLWKFKKEGEPSWPAPWGEGRPGWHIECSAMTWKCLGEKFDIHGGGLDLTFPHHECEIAQSEGCFGSGTFAKYWMHNGFINVDNEKMSKSLGNFFTLKDIFEKYDPRVVRFFFLQTHYRKPINFADTLLDQAKAGLQRLDDFVRGLRRIAGEGKESEAFAELIESARESFEVVMDEDFDTSGALGVVFELVKAVNVKIAGDECTPTDAQAVLDLLDEFDAVLAVILPEEDLHDERIEALIAEREKARENKDWARSDEIRDQLAEEGIVLEDGAEGTVWKRG